jgi:hypothetical protein
LVPKNMSNADVHVLVAGWFSFSYGHATAGDLLARDLTSEWLAKAGISHDIGLAPPFAGGIDWRTTRPSDYSHVVFVCGPFQQGSLEQQFLRHFLGCRLIGLDLSMLTPLDRWNPFDILFERDSSATSRPDIAFLSRQPLVPVVGRCLVEPYPDSHWDRAHKAIARFLGARNVAVVEIDTRLDLNSTGLRTPAAIESLIACGRACHDAIARPRACAQERCSRRCDRPDGRRRQDSAASGSHRLAPGLCG